VEKAPLVKGLREGFRLRSTIPTDPIKNGYTNHISASSNPSIVSKKLSVELALGRIAGPFSVKPFPNFVISPLGLVPKKEEGAYRLIHDLSFPKDFSVNSHIDPSFTSVRYELMDKCIAHIMSIGQGCLIAKADLKDAFRLLPVAPSDFRLLGFVWDDGLYFDRALPMGCSISCATFETLSRALQWIIVEKFKFPHVSHILDDFIFFGPSDSPRCSNALAAFLHVAASTSIPINDKKTVNPSTTVSLHGIEVDTVALSLRLPTDKKEDLLRKLSDMHCRKRVKLRELQSLLGSLNFACRAIVPGRAFVRRLTDLTRGVSNPNHFIRLSRASRKDIEAWRLFLTDFNGRVMCLPNSWISSDTLRLHSDACLASAAAVCGAEWFAVTFPESWSTRHIAIKELLPIVLAIQVWGPRLTNQRILFYCDNMSVVYVINGQTSKDSHLMNLLRKLVVLCLKYNIDLRAKHIPGKHNVVSDCLSRLQFERARHWAPWLHLQPRRLDQDWHSWGMSL
jgi:hypothetical protein